jgi:hypothetical protein
MRAHDVRTPGSGQWTGAGCSRLHRVVPARKGKRVISKIGAKGRQLPRPVDRLESEHALSEIRCMAEITGNKADVAQLLKCDHQALMCCIGWGYPTTLE